MSIFDTDLVLVTPWMKSTFSASNEACVECADWRKSSRSNSRGNCVECARWRTSARSTQAGGSFDCVEVGGGCDCAGVAVRDSKQTNGHILAFNRSTWGRFTATVKRGELDLV